MALTNFGFAPGDSPDPATPGHAGQQARIRAMVLRLPDTELIETADTVHDFIDGLRIDPAIDKPIGNALIGGHADSEGNFFISMFADQETVVDGIDEGQTNWEVLDATLDANHTEQSLNMDAIIDKSGTHFVHFKGCNLGKVTKFMKKFKAVLDANHVTAPAHFHGLTWQKNAGVYEHMAYEFKVFKKEPFTSRADLIDAFKAGGFTQIDGSPVDPKRWDDWVPANIKKKKVKTITFQLGQTAGGRKTLKADREFRVESTKKHAYRGQEEQAGLLSDNWALRQLLAPRLPGPTGPCRGPGCSLSRRGPCGWSPAATHGESRSARCFAAAAST
jgi:hypothetical protein